MSEQIQGRERRIRLAAYGVAIALVFLCIGYFLGRGQQMGTFTIYSDPSGLAAVNSKPTPTVGQAAVGELVNINTATEEQLQVLPGVGPAMAERIVSFREQYGPFISLEDMLHVSGIGEKTIEKFKGLVEW